MVPQLATGGIAAVLTSAEGGVNASFWEHLGAFTEINYAMPLNFVHIGRDAFDGLDESQRAALLQAAADADSRNWKAMEQRVQDNYKTLSEKGVTVAREISPDARAKLAQAAEKVVQEWLEKTGENRARNSGRFWRAGRTGVLIPVKTPRALSVGGASEVRDPPLLGALFYHDRPCEFSLPRRQCFGGGDAVRDVPAHHRGNRAAQHLGPLHFCAG